MHPKRRTAHIKTYGCQMNVYDSERMAELLAADGYAIADAPDDADVVLVNTCHIREKAAEKVYSDVGRLRLMAAERRAAGRGNMIVGVAGCVAQAEGPELLRRSSAINLAVGPQAYHRLPRLLRTLAARPGAQLLDTDFPDEDKFDHLPRARPARGPSAFVTVQEGCDKFCTFCVVPYTRGAEVSRPVARIVDEVERLVDQGVVEVTLLGQNVNGYHGADAAGPLSLAGLIERLARIAGLRRIRYTTSHPRDMTEELIALHGGEPKLMPFVHLPVQSGSDRMLAAMNRRHDALSYLAILERLRASRPGIALSGDFIVGFPGETEADFAATLDLARAAGYAMAYSFKYSPRPGTPAATLGEQVAEAIKVERLARLQDLLVSQQAAFNAGTVGQRFELLLERVGRRSGQFIGRSPYMQSVYVAAPAARLGDIITVEIRSAGPHSLEGAPLETAEAA